MSILNRYRASIACSAGLLMGCLFGATACAGTPLNVPAGESLSVHMHDHFTMALRARDGVIRGDLYQSQAPLIWLNQHTYQGELPPAWKPYVQRMQVAARDAIYADSVKDTAQAVAHLGSTCGACHRAFGRGPRVQASPPPPTVKVDARVSGALRPRMHQHAWAADRLWEGLIAPSEAAWSDGRNELHELTVERELSPALRDDLAKIHNLAQPLSGEPDDVQRSDRYAAIIATCGECHAALGVGP